MCTKKMRDFTEDPKEEIWGKSKISGLGGVLDTSYHSTTLQEVGILPTLVYFYPKGCLALFPPLGVVWLCFLP